MKFWALRRLIQYFAVAHVFSRHAAESSGTGGLQSQASRSTWPRIPVFRKRHVLGFAFRVFSVIVVNVIRRRRELRFELRAKRKLVTPNAKLRDEYLCIVHSIAEILVSAHVNQLGDHAGGKGVAEVVSPATAVYGEHVAHEVLGPERQVQPPKQSPGKLGARCAIFHEVFIAHELSERMRVASRLRAVGRAVIPSSDGNASEKTRCANRIMGLKTPALSSALVFAFSMRSK